MVTIPDGEGSIAPLIVILVLVLTVFVIIPYVMLVLLPDFKSLVFRAVLLIVFMGMAIRILDGNAVVGWLKIIVFVTAVRSFTLWVSQQGASERVICAIHAMGCVAMLVWITLSVLKLI